MNRSLQSCASRVEQSVGSQDSPYLTSDECAAYLKFRNLNAFYVWLYSGDGRELPRLRRGTRTLLFDRRVVDAFLRGELRSHQSVSRRLRVLHTDQPTDSSRTVTSPEKLTVR